MRAIYLDLSMGAAGDMLAAALLELHPEPQRFIDGFNAALSGKVRLIAERQSKQGIMGLHVTMDIGGEVEGEEHTRHEHHHHEHASVSKIYGVIDALPLPERVRRDAKAVYAMIAEAESAVHGQSMEQIHFHELGTMDALGDVVCVCMLMSELAPDRVLASPVTVGSGAVKCAHGILPVPAPATERLLRGIAYQAGEYTGEMCTPTGAALIKYYVNQVCPMPVMRVERCGYGLGTKDFGRLNAVRAMLGEVERQAESVIELRCNIDDMSGEELGFCVERLLDAGALDVWTQAIGMKKNRPAVMLCCLCHEAEREALLRCIFENTSTLGVREEVMSRHALVRRTETIETPLGALRIKHAEGFGVSRHKIEYDDLAAIARREGISLRAAREKAEKLIEE